MAKYRLSLRIEMQQGTRHPDTKVTWGCTRLPNTRVAGGIVSRNDGDRRRPEDWGEVFGVYEALKHAEASGETLAASEIEVAYESLTHVFKRGKAERSLVGPSFTRGVDASIYSEVNARKRPLGSD